MAKQTALSSVSSTRISKAARFAVEPLETRTLLSAAHGDPAALEYGRVAWEGQEAEAKKGEWIVRLDGAIDGKQGNRGLERANNLLRGARHDLTAIAALDDQGLLLVKAPESLSHGELRRSLRGVAGFKYAEPNVTLSLASTLPDDPSFSQQWGLNKIDAPVAWDRTTGDGTAIVAIIDTGVDYTHPDLNDNIWSNSGENGLDAFGRDKRTNGVDDDANGYTDDFRGWDFAGLGDNAPMDINGHGTHVAGITAAEGNNTVGISGVAWDAQVMPLRIFDDAGKGTLASALGAINYVTTMHRDHGVDVRVINASWGGTSYSQALSDSIYLAGNAGVLFVAAAGNGGTDNVGDNNDKAPFYPASYNLPNVISVAGSDSSDALTSHSNYGKTSVDLAAPGWGVYSTLHGNRYGYLSGTSMAAPYVAGAAALTFGAMPEATYQQVRDGIFNGVDPISAFSTKLATGGRLNLEGTLAQLLGPRPVVTEHRFDFGTASSPLSTGFTRVTETSAYSSGAGFGWTSGTRFSRDRGAGTDLQRDFVATANATFALDLANADYDVKVTLGDAAASHDDQGVFLEGVQKDSITTAAGQFVVRTYQVSVTDGQLTLNLKDLGGSDLYTTVNALEVVQSDPPAPIVQKMYDFGTASSPLSTGFTRVTETSAYSSAAGFGWTAGTRFSRDRGTGTDLERDFVATANATFAVDLANAAYDVKVTLGDAAAFHDDQGVFLEGVQKDSITTAAGQFVVRTYQVSVTDGQLTLNLKDLGGSDLYTTINAIEVIQSESTAPATVQNNYDFGTASSPLSTGFTRVTETSAYSSAAGFGWTAGTRFSRDRGTGTDLERDLVGTANATFAVDLANATYDVKVTLGDAAAFHDDQGVFLEGVQKDSITTSAGQFVVRTYRVTVGDGQLTLNLKDLGGSDLYTTINALEIASV